VTLNAGTIANGVLVGGSYHLLWGDVTAILAGSGELVKSGSLTVTLSGSNTYEGGTTLLSGTLALAAGGGLADTGSLTINGGVFDLGTLTEIVGDVSLLDGTIRNGTLVGSGYSVLGGVLEVNLAGPAALAKSGSATVVLNELNSYTGGTTVNGGTLRLGASERLLDAGSLTMVSGVFDLATYSETLGVVRLAGGEIMNGNLTGSAYLLESGSIGAALLGNAGLIKSGSGLVTLSGVNRYVGGTTVQDGTLELGGSELLAGSSTLNVDGGKFTLMNAAQTQSFGRVELNAGTLGSGTIISDEFLLRAGVVESVLSGVNGLIKSGAGTVSLYAANLLTGTLDLQAGMLRLGASERLSDSASLWVNGGTLDLNQFGETLSSVRLTGGSILAGSLSGSNYALEEGHIFASLKPAANILSLGFPSSLASVTKT
jgi:autotransporter-associated beta strand protein